MATINRAGGVNGKRGGGAELMQKNHRMRKGEKWIHFNLLRTSVGSECYLPRPEKCR
jgi:hypothetical protein